MTGFSSLEQYDPCLELRRALGWDQNFKARLASTKSILRVHERHARGLVVANVAGCNLHSMNESNICNLTICEPDALTLTLRLGQDFPKKFGREFIEREYSVAEVLARIFPISQRVRLSTPTGNLAIP